MTTSDVVRAVHRVLLPGFLGTTMPAWLAEALGQQLAGVVYFGQNISSPEQIRNLSEQIAGLNPAAIIATDEEGGNVTRLQHDAGSQVPGAALLGAMANPALTKLAGRQIGALCAAAGVNLTMAPDADVNTNPANPVIGVRSYGSDPATVSAHTSAMIRGIQTDGTVAACAKHFPGHGDTLTDSHLGLPRVDGDLSGFTARHLPPFQAAIGAGVRAMMSAHIIVDGLGERPATVNPQAMRLLRSQGFDGVIITDALDMAAIRNGLGSGEGAVQAIEAGADLLCIGNPDNAGEPDRDWHDFCEVRNALTRAVQQGRITLDRLAESARRVSMLGGLPPVPRATNPAPATVRVAGGATGATGTDSSPRTVDWLELAQSACRSASVNPVGAPVSAGEQYLQGKPVWRLADLRARPNQAVGKTESYFARELARLRVIDEVPADSPKADIAVVDALYPGSGQMKALTRLLKTSPGTVCVNAGVPLHRSARQASTTAGDGSALPSTAVVLNCFGAGPLSARAAAVILGGS